MVTLQSYWLDDRVVTTAGWRHVDYEQTRGEGIDEGTLDRVSFGIVAKPTSNVSVYYNYSENGQVPTSVQTLIPDESLFPVNSGEGQDYGVMLSLLEQRVFVRLGYFEANSVDQAKASAARTLTASSSAASCRPEALPFQREAELLMFDSEFLNHGWHG